MKKIDLHIHTVSNPLSDSSFEFDINVLKKYVNDMEIDGIAITNHNVFDKEQFEYINKELKQTVLPGVEIDIAAGHLLLIGKEENIDKIDIGSKRLKEILSKEKRHISYEEFIDFFGNPEDYLLIPHYTKKPRIHPECEKQFGDNIFCGEVSGHKSFITTKKDVNNKISPVYFSDFRASSDFKLTNEKNVFPVRYTYIDVDEVSYHSIKIALQDKTKVFLNKEKEDDKFVISRNEVVASDKLNLIVGKRSSGKTQLLKEISKSVETEDLLYIKQFDITSSSQPDEFEKILRNNQENNVEEYMKPIRNSINSILSLNQEELFIEMDEYLDSLKKYAHRTDIEDAYSKMKIFNTKNFNKKNNTNLKILIKSVNDVSKNQEYKSIINKYIMESQLIGLQTELINKYKQDEKTYILTKRVDNIVNTTKKKLSKKSAKTSVDNIDLLKIFTNLEKIKRFDKKIIQISESEKPIYENKTGKFTELVSKTRFENTKAVQKSLGSSNIAMKEIYDKFYVDFSPYRYLTSLRNKGIEEGKLYKALFKIKYVVLNEKDTPVSGGETAEFNLLNQIEHAKGFEVLLMDEPEASFDNEFIHREILPLIKRISENTTVFIVTHNNTMGTLIQPNNIIFTHFDMDLYKAGVSKQECFKIYSGKFTDSILKNKNNQEIKNYDVLLNTMEAGISAYGERKRVYENIKN
ncbi:hypothetical protein M2901_09130 [Vagococcus lutrae]|uniref:hypothetical protein n=1 Tax=Vagococcus lutrae TaxID=81947 RepID=UPI00200BAA45|nr:hypothetical protein [Vagococcus lutrae]UQF70907.1 hypothetical protein M2901_09130 [Vagococcus lutrae]